MDPRSRRELGKCLKQKKPKQEIFAICNGKRWAFSSDFMYFYLMFKLTDFISLEVLFKYFHSNRQILKAKLPELSVTSAFCQHTHNPKLYPVIKYVRAVCWKHGYPHPDSRDLMKKYVPSHNNVVSLFFFPLKSHCSVTKLI